MNNKKYLWFEYLGVIALWFLIFGKNAFSNLLFVDYIPVTTGFLKRSLIANNFTSSISAISLLREIFGIIGIERVFFSFTILFAMIVSYYYISKLIQGKKRMLFALIFFFSPFVYTRLMIGQLGIIVAYLLMPMFLVYLFEMFSKELEYKSVLKAVLVMTLVGAMTPHFFVINFIMFLIGSFWFYFYKNKFDIRKYFKVLGVFVLLLLLSNLYWIQGLFAGGMLGEINEKHEDFFAPRASTGVSAIAKVAGMWGFWREGAYDRVYTLIPLWLWYGIIGLLVLLLLVGYYSDNENKKSKFFYTLFWIGLILGVGISHPYTGKIFEILFKNFPFFNGFRDSHKFVSFIALAYAYFLPNAIISITKSLKDEKIRKLLSVIVVAGLLALIFGLNFTMINLNGQVRNTEYLNSYQEVNNFFNNQEVNGKIIYLPWQGYLTYNWSRNVSSDGRIGAFINGIIEKGVISGPDEYGGNSGFRLEISNCLNEEDVVCLKEKGVEYVMQDKCAYYPDDYSWLKSEENVFESECVDVYYIGGKIEDNKIPLRFLVSVFISALTLVYIVFVLGNGRLRKRQE